MAAELRPIRERRVKERFDFVIPATPSAERHLAATV